MMTAMKDGVADAMAARGEQTAAAARAAAPAGNAGGAPASPGPVRVHFAAATGEDAGEEAEGDVAGVHFGL